MVFRQFTGAPAMDVYFETGIPQAWAWTLLAPYIQSCPQENPRIGWSNFPALEVVNNPSLSYAGSQSDVSTNITQLTFPNQTTIQLRWENPGKSVGPDQSYTTVKNGGKAKYALFQQSYNISYAPITFTGENEGTAVIPEAIIYDTDIAFTNTAFNGTGFVAVVDSNPTLTPYNSSLILPHMVAGVSAVTPFFFRRLSLNLAVAARYHPVWLDHQDCNDSTL